MTISTTPKYIDLLTDYGFKRIFGNKEFLIAFLNSLFEKEGKVIKSVTYINKEITPVNKEDRTIIYDLLCKVDGQEDIIIEMQHKSQVTFQERSLYYMSRAIDRQANGKNNWKYKLHPVYGIFITNFHLKEVKLPDSAVSEYVIKNKKTNEEFTNKFRMIFIDLLAFKKKDENELDTDLEKWIYSIKNMGNMTTAPRMASSGVFFHLYNDAELAALTTRERNRYERSLKNYRDILADKETTRIRLKEALKEGREKERQKAYQEKLSSALALKNNGVPVIVIAQSLGLTQEVIDSL